MGVLLTVGILVAFIAALSAAAFFAAAAFAAAALSAAAFFAAAVALSVAASAGLISFLMPDFTVESDFSSFLGVARTFVEVPFTAGKPLAVTSSCWLPYLSDWCK